MLFMSCVCHALTSVHCCLVVTFGREKGDLLALFVMLIVILLLSHSVSCGT